MSVRPRVLLAEDHPAMAQTLSRLLSGDCDVVAVVGDGAQLLATAVRLRPLVVVADIHLPHVNGLDACRELLRSDPPVPVILISAAVDETVRDEARAAGATAVVGKSAVDELVTTIQRAWTVVRAAI